MSKSSKKTILVVDDDPIGLNLLARTLEGYEVVTAENGLSALQVVSQKIPDLILLDIRMPLMDGFEVCKQLKNSPETAHIPVIFITGLTDHKDINMGFEMGAVDFITKPFDVKEVNARVKTHLTLKTAQESLRQKNSVLKKVINEQNINSQFARKILNLINSTPPRYIDLENNLSLIINIFSQPSHNEGGDHFLVRTLPGKQNNSQRTIISLKDQSGHSVNCILRSIITDLIHNSILHNNQEFSLSESMSHLNDEIIKTNLFNADDFLTGLTAEIDHANLNLNFSLAGHPPFLFIRGGIVFRFPQKNSPGSNLPLGFQEEIEFTSHSLKLQEGDKLIFYTDGLTDMPLMHTDKSLTSDELFTLIQDILAKKQSCTISSLMKLLLNRIREMSLGENSNQQYFHDDITVLGLEIEGQSHTVETKTLTDITDIDSEISSVLEKILHQCSRKNIHIDETKLELAISEAILNAWKHGNQKDPQQTITIRWWFSNDLNIEITDQGSGFSFTRTDNPSKRNNLIKQNGRGIFLIRQVADSVHWYDGGRRMVISFQIEKCDWGQKIYTGEIDTQFNLWQV